MDVDSLFGPIPCIGMILRPKLPQLVGAAASIPFIEKTRHSLQSCAHNVHDSKAGAEGFNDVAAAGAFLRQDQSQLLAAEHLLAPPLVNEDLSVQLVLALNRGLFET